MYEFGERIYNLRKKSGLSQEDFADKLGVSRQAVSKWETGQSVPDSEKASAIAKFFGVSLDWLINGEEINVPAPQPEQPQPVSAQPTAVTDAVGQSVSAETVSETDTGDRAEEAVHTEPEKKKPWWVRALILAGIITLAFIGVSALSAFIFMLVAMKSANLGDPQTFYMLLMVVPGWVVIFAVAFVVSIIIIKKKRKK